MCFGADTSCVVSLAQGCVHPFGDHHLRAVQGLPLLGDRVVGVDHQRLVDPRLAGLRRGQVLVEQIESDLGAPDPVEIGPPRLVVEPGRQHVVVVLLEDHCRSAATFEFLGERLTDLGLAAARFAGHRDREPPPHPVDPIDEAIDDLFSGPSVFFADEDDVTLHRVNLTLTIRARRKNRSAHSTPRMEQAGSSQAVWGPATRHGPGPSALADAEHRRARCPRG